MDLRIAQPGPGRNVVVPRWDGKIGLVRAYRYPVGRAMRELPGGCSQSVDDVETVRNELMEETGATLSRATLLGMVTPDPGLLATDVSAYLADVAETPGG